MSPEVPTAFKWMALGRPVYYHAVIGEEPTLKTEIRYEPWLLPCHDWVVMVKGVSGCVACEAISPRLANVPLDAFRLLEFDSAEERDAAVAVLAAAVAYEVEPYEEQKIRLFHFVREYLGVQERAEDELEVWESDPGEPDA